MARRFLIAIAVMALAMFVAPLAKADTGDVIEPQHDPPTAADGFQAGTCYENQLEEDPVKAFCSPETSALFFTQAGGIHRSASTSTSSGMKRSCRAWSNR